MKVKLIIDFSEKESYEMIKYLVEYSCCKELDLEIQGYDVNKNGNINRAYYGLYYACKYGVSLEYVNRVLKALFEENRDIGALEVIADCYEDIGYDRNDLIDAMMDGDYEEMFKYLQACLDKEGIKEKCFAYIYDDDKGIYIGKDKIVKAIEGK